MSNLTPRAEEAGRLLALRSYRILGTPPEPCFDRITALAARLLGAPFAALCFVDETREWWKSAYGLDAGGREREGSAGSQAILSDVVTLLPGEAQGPPGVRFCAAAPLIDPDGFRLGALSVMDVAARETWTPLDSALLTDLAAVAVDELGLRRTAENERELLLSRRRHAERMEKLGSLAGTLSHDLKGALTVILGHGDMLLSTLDDSGPIRSSVEEILKAAERATGLTHQLSAFRSWQPQAAKQNPKSDS